MRLCLSWNAAIPAVALLAGILQLSSPTRAQETNGRVQRCVQLQQKLDIAIAMKPPTANSGSIHALRAKAIHFCMHNREAQGARAFAKALVLYGMHPFAGDEDLSGEPLDDGSLQ